MPEWPEAADLARAWDAALMMGDDRLLSMALAALAEPPEVPQRHRKLTE